MNVRVDTARRELHDQLVKIARTGGKYTRDFSNHIFSGEHAYEKGWIAVAHWTGSIASPPGLVCPPALGYYCVRHKVREPVTELYFITVDPAARGYGVGRALIDHLAANSPHKRIGLNCAKDNGGALKFYDRLGFEIVDEALKGTGYRLEKVYP